MSLLAEKCNFLYHSLWISRVSIFLVFLISECKSIGVGSEPEEQECEGRMVEESLLCLLAVLVHGLTYDSERYKWILKVVVVLVVSV